MIAPVTKESAIAVFELLKGKDVEGKFREECTVGGHRRVDPTLCDKESVAIAQFMDALKAKERVRTIHEVWYSLKAKLGPGEHQQILNEVTDAIRATPHTQEGWNA